MQSIIKFLKSEDGPTAVEYAVMLAMIVMVCIAGVALLGQQARDSFVDSNDRITSAMGN